MKKIIIIDTYPISESHKSTLDSCIKSLNSSEFDIMVVSHAAIESSTQDSVDYVLYDKENILLPQNLTPYWWMESKEFNIVIHDNGHSLTICKNMKTSISLANSLGYDFFYFIESDNIFNETDLDKLIKLSSEVRNNGKNMFFFKQDYSENEQMYETLIFGGEPSYFLNKIQLPTNVDEFINFNYKPTLELSFYDQLSKYESDFMILDTKSSDYFSESVINKFSQSSFKCEILKTNESSYVLFIVNDARNHETIYVSINDSTNITMTPDSWYYLPIDESMSECNVVIIEGDYRVNKNFNLIKKIKYDEKGIFEFNRD